MMNNKSFESFTSDARIPFVIGVTGHIDIADPETVENSLAAIFKELGREMPDTPFLLLSPLAEGADRLFVNTARKILGDRIKCVAVLPFSVEEYMKDFETQPSKDEFTSLLEHTLYSIPAGKDVDVATDRDAGYCCAGNVIVKNANMLIAIWDGRKAVDQSNNALRGGTSYVVENCLSRRQEDGASVLDPARTIPVLQIITERKKPKGAEFIDGIPSVLRSPGTIVCHFPDGMCEDYGREPKVCLTGRRGWLCKAFNSNERKFIKVLVNIQKYNRIVLKNTQRLADTAEKSKRYLGLDPDVAIPRQVQEDADRFGICDALANRKQVAYKRAFYLLFGVSLFTVIMAQIYSDIMNTHFILSLYLGGLVAAYILFVVFIKCLHLDSVYHDYRVLAEALRVQIYWRLSGISDRVSDYVLKKQRGELEWLRIALQNWRLLDPYDEACFPPSLKVVHHAWIKDQMRFYSNGRSKYLRYSAMLSRIALVCYLVSLVLAVLFVACAESVKPDEVCATFWVGLGPFVLAVLEFYKDKTAWAEHAKAYTYAGRLFLVANERFNQSTDDSDKVMVARKLGQEALQELSEWVLLYRTRRLEPMK